MNTYHTIFIGGGINNLVCATILAKSGKKVLIIERSKFLGGCIRSEEIEGCIIDTLSTAYPLFVTSPAYNELKVDLDAEGIEFCTTETPTGTILSDKSYALIKTDREKNRADYNNLSSKDGDKFRDEIGFIEQNADFLFSFLGKELVTFSMAKYIVKYVWKTGIKDTLDKVGAFTSNVRNDLPKHFNGKELQATLAPWVLHTGLSPDSPFSATMAKIVAFTIELVGLPMVKGGSYKIVEAFKNIIEKNGGEIQLEQDVEEILVNTNATVSGVKTGIKTYNAKNVVASITPTQLYGRLLKFSTKIPKKVSEDANNYKYGMGNMQIHIIMNEAPKWYDKNLSKVTYAHLSDGINDVAEACTQAKNQELPAKCTIAIGQPTATDPSRATDGKHVLWIQLPECPNFPKADSSGELSHLCKGEWTEELREAYADKIIHRISDYISNIKSATIARKVISPKDLSQLNINLVNGDPYGGLCEIEQYLVFRPLKSTKNHTTPIKNLYHSGASTHPGPGLGGGAGFLIAQHLK
ncbi:phytoene desaturase family protein [Tenacibaculum sp. UWU-22]|uniref:phytoene desaturase family protein n=1 Tax=Tenacibaculum sp. UWU-22 TaxID=3234187 RepID=UPI0034DB7136